MKSQWVFLTGTELFSECHFRDPVFFHTVVLQGGYQWRKSMEDHAGKFQWSRLGFWHFHQSTWSPLTHKAILDCKGAWDVPSWVCPGGRADEIGPQLANLCHTWHLPSTFELSFFILSASLYFKFGGEGNRKIFPPTSMPLLLLSFLLWIIFLGNLRSEVNCHLFTEACACTPS